MYEIIHKGGIPMVSSAREHMNRLNLLTTEIESTYHEIALAMGLSDSVMMILYILYLTGGSCLIGEAIVLSGLSKQTINSALRKLEQEGAIRLEAGEGRRKRVCLTEHGKGLCQKTVVQVVQAENEILGSWPAEEQELYVRLTQRFLTALQEKARALRQPGEAPPANKEEL